MSALAGRAQEYLRLRRALGHELAEAARLLPRFVAYLDSIGATSVTVEAALAWAQQPDTGPGSKVRARRMTVARGFARHMASIDPDTQVPPLGLVPYRQRWRPPFIYTDADVQALMAQAARAIPTALRAVTYQTLIGLLAATGMRVGEALRLPCSDVDWDEGVVTIRASKFGKSRHLPLSATTVEALAAYERQRNRHQPRPRATTFFVSTVGTAVIYADFGATFRELIRATGVGQRSPVHPRIHDLRHSCAVRTLVCWYRAGEDVNALLPRLSTYLGHRDRPAPTGICRPPPSCWPWPPAGSKPRRRPDHDRVRRHVAAVLHRAAGQTTPSQQPHRDRLPRRLPAPAAFRAGPHRQRTIHTGLGRRQRPDNLGIPGPPRDRPAQQRPQPKRPTGRAALAVSLRGPAPPRTHPAHPTGAGHPPETIRPHPGAVPRLNRS